MSIDVDFSLNEIVGILEGIDVRSGSAVHQPSDTLETSTSVDNLNVKVLTRSIVECFVLHKDHVTYFEATHEELNGRS